jgi:hypothetical protein
VIHRLAMEQTSSSFIVNASKTLNKVYLKFLPRFSNKIFHPLFKSYNNRTEFTVFCTAVAINISEETSDSIFRV